MREFAAPGAYAGRRDWAVAVKLLPANTWDLRPDRGNCLFRQKHPLLIF
jgi:hypothetical protein